MQQSVIDNKNKAEYYFEEGCFITELSNSDQDEAVSIARARVEPGKVTVWHALKETTERYVILSGSGEVGIGVQTTTVTVADVVIIPPDTAQRIACTSQSDLIFLAICTPPFSPDNYINLEG
ncbi:MAG: mannose-6-phosphate isomerase-like protein (cupin superfamily) [Gammaproteobacteria bacterium]|jgi:mannose-6-phosphate isomerase-like protein (cupin superfamily)